MYGSQMYDCVVIGGGIVGVCIAYELADRGVEVCVLDGEGICEGASYGNAGVVSSWACVPISMPGMWRESLKWLLDVEAPLFIRFGHILPFIPWGLRFLREGNRASAGKNADGMLALCRGSADAYQSYLEGTGKEHLLKDSFYIYAYRDKSKTDLNRLEWRLRKERGIAIERIDSKELQALEPELSERFESAVILGNHARTTNPMGMGKAIWQKAKAKGAKLLPHQVEKLIKTADGFKIVTQQETLQTKQVVLSAGVWSAKLLGAFGISVPLEAERGYHLFLQNSGIDIQNSVMDGDRYAVASAMEGGVRIAGTAEFAGIDAPPDFRRARTFLKLIKEMFPDIKTDHAKEWMGRRPSMPDSLPCLGELEDVKGLFLAFGHAHYGLSMAPATAKLIADAVIGKPDTRRLCSYSIKRF